MVDSTSPRIFPFIVGVSGHRDLDPDDVPRLRAAVSTFVHQLKQYLPDTELRFIVGMAEGADLLLAQIALDLGVRVEAVLPMPLAQYSADFDAQTLQLLRSLLRRSDVRCVKLVSPLPTTDAVTPHTAAERDAMYANLTEVLIRRSSLLLALWDGQTARLPGGTADTVLRYLGIRHEDSRDEQQVEFVDAPVELDSTARLVYWTPAARSGGAPAAGVRQPCYLLGVGDNLVHMQQTMPAQLQH